MQRRTWQFVLLPSAVVLSAALVASCSDSPKVPVAPNGGTPALSGAVADAYAGGQIHGAIFTTTPNGGTVNANVQYTDKRQVYLDGGPKGNAPITAAGLPDGLYVFQITDPPGKVLLSDDPSKCRVVQVAGGVIKQLVAPADLPAPYGPLSNTFGNPSTACSIADSPEGAAGISGHHDTNQDVDHWSDAQAIVVQMMPFLDTPNPGGVYKAWMTPLAVYAAKGGQLGTQTQSSKVQGKTVGYARDPGFAAPLNKVKTDNFKVTQNPPFVSIDKLVDENRDGLRAGDPAFAVAPGWPVTVTEQTDQGAVTNDYFAPTGGVAVPQNATVMVCERILPTWYFSYAYVDGAKVTPLASPTTDIDGNPIKCVNATAGTNNTVLVAFGNYQLPNLEIAKSPQTQTVVSGDPINWTITVSNTGLGKAFGVYIADQLQAVTGGTYSTSTAGCSISGSLLLSCTVGDLAGGASFAAAVRLQTASGEFCGTVTNTARAGGTGLSEITSNTVSATVTGCGRMTGGSGQVQITDDTFLTSGFTIHCDIVLSNNLEINWPNNKWHISKPITYARCIDDPLVNPGQPDAPFDTFVGRAVGELNGVAGSTVEFTFVDAGEPGKIADRASIRVKDKFGTTVLSISNVPIKGNLQAHEDQPHQ